MHPDTFAVYRSFLAGKDAIPLEVRSVGRYRVGPAWRDNVRRKRFHQLFWTFEGSGQFLAGKNRYIVGPGDIFFYRPGDIHQVSVLSSRWSYCWITWDHSECRRWLLSFGLRERIHRCGTCPQWLFEEAAEGLRAGLQEGARRAAQAAFGILLETTAKEKGSASAHRLAEQVRAQLDARFSDPLLSMEKIAAQFHVHRSTLFRTFHAAYGITPSGYLQHRRMQTGLSLLYRSGLRISEAAQEAGFSNPNYFSRAVKKAVGASPRDFRLRLRQKSP